MRTISYRIGDLERATIHIGRVAENEYTRVQIDAGDIYAQYPHAAAALTVQPPAGEAYPAVVTREGNLVIWDVPDSALTDEGLGEIQLTFTENGVVVKSAIGQISVCRSIIGEGEAPDPLEDFLAEAGAALTAIPETIEAALEAAKESGEFDGTDGFSPVVTVSEISGGHSVSVTDAEGTQTFNVMDGDKGDPGDPGQPGYSPSASVTKSGSTATIVITDKDGTTTAQISDGEGADVIDDTSTASDKAWSASKVSGELSNLNSAITQRGIPSGGTTGKVLAKASGTDYDVEWVDQSGGGSEHGVPSGGSTDQVLAKNSGTDYDLKWMTLSGGGTVDDELSDSSTNPVQNKVITGVINAVTDKNVSPNLYDKNTCNPQDKKVYNNSHQYSSSNSYAVTGKIPVQANTKYKFWAGENVNIKYVTQWSGDSGATFVSETQISGAAFTTGASTTFVDFEIFARTHTTDEYNAAIACAMLVEGETVPETYQPYGQVTYYVPTDALEDEEAVEGAKNYTVMKSLVNIYDKSLAQDNKVFNTNKVVDHANYAFTGLIPVEPNSQYCFSIQKGLEYGYISAYYQRWNASKVFIDEVSGHQSTNFLNQIQTTAQTAYVSFCIYFGAEHTTEAFETAIDTVMVVEGCQEPAEYVPYNYEPVVNHLKFDTEYRDNADRFKGKRWLAFGTSVTYQDSKYYTEGIAEGEVVRGYVGDVARRKPMLVENRGISGSTLGNNDGASSSLINRYQNFTYTNYDFVTLEYGINDFGNDIPVGTASDAAGTSTFAACLKTIIEYILTENPIIGLIICTDPDVRGTNKNNNNNTLKDYADVMLEIAAQYRLPVCDWFYHSGINSITKGDGSSRYFLTQSGTHPSVYGHMRMGAMLNQVFDSLLC